MTTPYFVAPVFSWPAAPGGKLHTYAAGGTTPQATYSDAAGVTPNTNPVTLDSLGSAVVRLAVGVAYHMVLKDSLDVTTLWDADNYDNNYLSTASTVGAVLYPRTTAEIAAGITPTDYTYPFGDVRRYNILNDGTTDVTAACNTLGAAVWPSETVLSFPAGQYKITNTVTFTGGNIHIAMQPGAQFVYSGTADRSAIVRDYGTSASARTETYNVTTAVSHPYTNFAFIGVQLKGSLSSSHINLDYAIGFTIGWQIAGNSANGVSYNDFKLGVCFDCAYQLNIHSTGPGNGFVNENNFFNGQFQVSGAFNTANPTVAVYGVVFDADPGGYTGHNNNHFWKPCFQLSHTASNPAREPIWMKNAGGYNQFHDIRAEGLYGAVMHIDSDTVSVSNNKLEIGYIGAAGGNITALISETDGGFSYANWCTMFPGIETRSHHHSGDLVQKAWAPASANYGVLGHFVQSSASGTEAASGPGEVGKDFLVINSGSGSLGIYVDTSFYKEFEVRADLLATRSGRIAVAAYDSTGTQITSTRAVYGQLGTQNASYGGASYTTSADPNVPLAFRVDSTVKSIKIFFASGTNPMCLRSYTITAYATGSFFATSGNPNLGLAVFGGPFSPVQKINTTAPNGILGEGYTPRGDIRWNGNAVAGNTVPAGHICTAAGWNARAWVATTAYDLNQIRTNDTAPVKTYVCRTKGTSAGSGGPTGTGTGIVDNTCTWDYIGTPVTTVATWAALANVP